MSNLGSGEVALIFVLLLLAIVGGIAFVVARRRSVRPE